MEWGQRGGVSVADILDQIKASDMQDAGKAAEGGPAGSKPVQPPGAFSDTSLSPPPSEGEVATAGSAAAEGPAGDEQAAAGSNSEPAEPPAKRQKEMTLEEYEAMLDEEEGGGFLEAADLYNIP